MFSKKDDSKTEEKRFKIIVTNYETAKLSYYPSLPAR